jgi:hypothetical protein
MMEEYRSPGAWEGDWYLLPEDNGSNPGQGVVQQRRILDWPFSGPAKNKKITDV